MNNSSPGLSGPPRPRVHVHPGIHIPENLEPRALCVLNLDLSGSFSIHAARLPEVLGDLIRKLNKIRENQLRMEVAVEVFATDVTFHGFAPLSVYQEAEFDLQFGGCTALGTSLKVMADQVCQRRKSLTADGRHPYRSVGIVVTDGKATDPDVLWEMMPTIKRLEAEQELEVVPIPLSKDDVPLLSHVFGKPPSLAEDLDFERLFAAIARSMSEYSRSCPGYEPLVGDLIPQAYESDKKHLALTAPTGTLRRIAPPGE